jgi:lysyl-tRNA synthetase class 2
MLKGSYKFLAHPFHGDSSSEPIEIDFTPPFKRISMISTLEEALKVKFPRPLNSQECNKFLCDLCEERGIKVTPPMTTSRILDTLTGEFIEPLCKNPTFITDHPQVMSPLAKYHRNDSELTERFELFIMGKEFCNAYTELNNPHVQRECFKSQLEDKKKGDDEAQMVDWTFVDALDHGLPPTGGWGLGIDRLVMLLTGQTNIKEVITFPMMRDV